MPFLNKLRECYRCYL